VWGFEIMASSEPDERIEAESHLPVAPLSDASGHPIEDDASGRYHMRLSGTLFGALAGIPLGALTVAIGAWIADFGDHAWEAALYGAGGGVFGGALIGFIERTIRGDLAKPDIATWIGGIFGLAIAPLMLLVIHGGTVYVIVGILFTGPMGGLLCGAMLDRAHDASMRRWWSSAIGFGGFAIAACVAIVFSISEYTDPAPEIVARDARKLIHDHWHADPELKEATIRKIALDPPVHRTYTGTMEAVLAGKTQRFDLQVYVRHDEIKAEWFPRD
jgi:hypothetical protein